MKKLILFSVLLSTLASCASGPTLLLVKNCKDLGSSLYQCEELSKQDVQGGTRKDL